MAFTPRVGKKLTPEEAQRVQEQFKPQLGTSVGRVDVAQERAGFGADLSGDIRETIQGIKSSIERGAEKQQAIDVATRQGEQGRGRQLLQSIGTGAGTVSNIVGDIAIGAGKAVLPQGAEDFIKQKFEAVTGKVLETDTAQKIVNKFNQIEQEDPVLARDLQALLGVGSLGLDIGTFGAGRAVTATGREAVEQAGKQAVVKGTETAISAGKVTARGVTDTSGKLTKFGLSQISGLSDDTIETIAKNAVKFEKAKNTPITRLSLAETVDNAIETRIKNVATFGPQYRAVREAGVTVTLPEDFIGGILKKDFGFDVVDGKIVAGTKSKTRNTADIGAIQKLYDDWGDRVNIDSDEFLNLRGDLSDLAKFDKASGRTSASETIAKDIRASLNADDIRTQIPNLKELDAQFAPEIEQLTKIRKEFLDKDGNLKDSAINRIANAAGKGKDQQLNRLKALVPDIEERIKLLKAVEDIDIAKNNKVGVYVRPGATIAAFFVNPVLGIGTFLLSSPETLAQFLTFIGKKTPQLKARFDEIITKIEKGLTLSKKQKELLGKTLDMTADTANEFIDSLGGATGISVIENLEELVGKQQPPETQ